MNFLITEFLDYCFSLSVFCLIGVESGRFYEIICVDLRFTSYMELRLLISAEVFFCINFKRTVKYYLLRSVTDTLMVQTEPVEEERPKCGCKGVRFCAACKDTLRWDKIPANINK